MTVFLHILMTIMSKQTHIMFYYRCFVALSEPLSGIECCDHFVWFVGFRFSSGLGTAQAFAAAVARGAME